MKKFDAIIIGSGQAGTPLAFKLASHNKTVAFIEKQQVGGTCVNVGCTPTKTYVASARRMWEAFHGDELGIMIPKGVMADMKRIKGRKDAIVQEAVQGIADGLEENARITWYKGEGVFTGHKTVMVNGEELTAEWVFINVGGRPVLPQGYENVPFLTSSSILDLEEVPEHLVIVGGSYIGLEFGQMFRRFGSRVTIIEKGENIIGREDPEVSETILSILKEEGIEFRLQATCLTGQKENNGQISVEIDCRLGGSPKVSGSHLLLAVGRQPNTDLLNLSATSVKSDSKGYITVDDNLQTNVEGIYALGDCNGKGGFTHTAYNDFEIVSENLLDGKDRKVSDRIKTYGLFVDPPLGRAGLTKKEAREMNYKVLEGRREMKNIARAKEKGETHGFISILVDGKTDLILGASILGVGGDEIISLLLTCMYSKLPYHIIMNSVLPHPTVSELLPTILASLEDPDFHQG